jgi:hypothetical protein
MYALCIVVIKHIQDMEMYSSTSILERIIKVGSLKIQRVMCIMMVIEEGPTRH